MRHAWVKIFVVLGLLMVSLCGFAVTHQGEKVLFPTEEAQKHYAIMEALFSNPNDSSVERLTAAVEKLEKLRQQAKTCIEESQEQLKQIDEMLKIAPVDSTPSLQQTDYQYLQDKKSFYTKQLSECRFFLYRSSRVLAAYKNKIQVLSRYQILKRGTPVWKIYEVNVLASLDAISGDKIYLTSGASKLSTLQFIIGLFVLFFSTGIAVYIQFLLQRALLVDDKSHPKLSALLAVLATFLVPLVILSAMSVFFAVVYWSQPVNPWLEMLSYYLLIFTVLLAALRYLFSPPLQKPNPIHLPSDLGSVFYNRACVLLIWILLAYVVMTLIEGQVLPPQFIEMIRTLYLTVLVVLIIRFCWLIAMIPAIQKRSKTAPILLKTFFILLFFTMLATEWLGFHRLALYLVTGALLSLILVAAAIASVLIIEGFYQLVNNRDYYISRKIRQFFSIKPHRNLSEVILIKFALYIAVICLFIIAFSIIWDVSTNFIDAFVDGLFNGFHIGKLKIIPTRIALALVLFSLIFLIGRGLSAVVTRKRHHIGEEDTQVAFSSLILYFAFAIALLFGLLIAGVNFTGLAIIAGALSVGIGLGLQGIVNDFASGLILLLEKPVKPGDRVIVGTTEGFIKKIRIRSTQITTMAKEDVIVPNSDLISQQVTNYMFRDRSWRVTCQVGVAYGSDVSLVKEVLLTIASKHPDVIQEEPNQPVVLFRSFGESSLVFELWCIIRDVNRKFAVQSDLHFSIDEAFRYHRIIIPFPQRDIHIK